MDCQELLQQLGGHRFITMTGAKNFVKSDNDLSFKVGRNCHGITHVRITLNANDLYDIEFIKVRKYTPKVAATVRGVFCDNLQAVFTQGTGLDTHL